MEPIREHEVVVLAADSGRMLQEPWNGCHARAASERAGRRLHHVWVYWFAHPVRCWG